MYRQYCSLCFFFNDTATTEIYTLSTRRSSDLGAAAEHLVPGLVVDVLHDLAHQVDPGGEDPGYDSRGRVSDREGAVYEQQAPEERHGHIPRQAAALEHGRIQPEHGEGREAHEHRGPVDEGRGAEPDHGPTRDAQVGGAPGHAARGRRAPPTRPGDPVGGLG